jgi:hypothetical protein
MIDDTIELRLTGATGSLLPCHRSERVLLEFRFLQQPIPCALSPVPCPLPSVMAQTGLLIRIVGMASDLPSIPDHLFPRPL